MRGSEIIWINVQADARTRPESSSELYSHARARSHVRSSYRSLLTGQAAADGFQLKAGVLSGFECAAHGFAYEGWDFDSALFYVEDDCALGREDRLRGSL